MKSLAMIMAISKNDVIGNAGKLPWRYPEDLKRFKVLTTGHAVIMGRKTFEDIGKPLPNRRNVIISSTLGPIEDCDVVTSFEEAFTVAKEIDCEPFVIGGVGVFRAALPFVTTIHLTEIAAVHPGDTFFHLDRYAFYEVGRTLGADPALSFVTLERFGVKS